MKDIIVRPECAADYEAVSDLLTAAFSSSRESEFVVAMRRRTEGFDPAMSLVAEDGDGISVGYLLLFPLAHSDCRILAMYPVAILPELQRRGIGKALIREGLRVARSRGYGGVLVLGERRYYSCFGFRPAEEWGIFSDFEVSEKQCFMAFEFDFCGLTPGRVCYPREFFSL